MFNFTSNTCWTSNGSATSCDPIIDLSDQTTLNNHHKPCLNSTTPNILKQQHYYNHYDTISLPQLAADDHDHHHGYHDHHHDHDTTSTSVHVAASPFSFVYLPPPLTPLFEDQHTSIQHFQLPYNQNRIGIAPNNISSSSPRAAFSVIGDPIVTGKALGAADCPAVANKTTNNSSGTVPMAVTDHQHDHLNIPMAKESGRSNRKKRDRHSKIVTSSRPRHRRMRLSIDVARQFFDLQERLGFDRASKTVEWLLVHARADIRKLRKESCSKASDSSASNSDCEVISGLDHEAATLSGGGGGDQEGAAGAGAGAGGAAAGGSKPACPKAKRKYNRRSAAQPARRCAFDPEARQARAMARKRAKNRTMEKKLTQGVSVDSLQPMSIQDHDQDQDQIMMSRNSHSRFLENGLESVSQNLIGDHCTSMETVRPVLLQDDDHHHHHHFYGHDELVIGVAEENNHHLPVIAATPLMNVHEDHFCGFVNAEKQHCNQSLLHSFSNNMSLHNSTSSSTVLGPRIQQDQHQRNLDYQFLAKAWNQFCMSSHNMS